MQYDMKLPRRYAEIDVTPTSDGCISVAELWIMVFRFTQRFARLNNPVSMNEHATIDQIYEAALVSDTWKEVLQAIVWAYSPRAGSFS